MKRLATTKPWLPGLVRFSIRRGTGGKGVYRGGDGLVRHYRFLRDVQMSLLTERRNTPPFGLEGGGAGARGRNWRVTPQGDKTAALALLALAFRMLIHMD